jgi:hypothetical protein
MSDPRNVAHDKKVKQGKAHQAPGSEEAKPKKRRKGSVPPASDDNAAASATQTAAVEQAPGELEKSVAVLSKLKDLEFHSRANIETLAGLTLTIDDELKQKEFVDPLGALYAAQDAFQTQIAALVASYEAKCESLKPSA